MIEREKEIEEASSKTHYGPFGRYTFEQGAKWADEHPKSPWISVKDRLPEYDEDVIGAYLCSDNSTAIIQTYRSKDEDKTWAYARYDKNDFKTGLSGTPILYWCPIPELPKEGGEQ